MNQRELIDALLSGKVVSAEEGFTFWKDEYGYHVSWVSVAGELHYKELSSIQDVLKNMGKDWKDYKVVS